MYEVKRKSCEASLASEIVELFEDDECSMTDVTLACEGQFIQAHKLVLAASSPFFKRFIKMNRADKGGTVLIVLANVKFSELKAIVHLIYYGEGEILVGKDDYEGFLKAVKLLELESIIDFGDREDELDLHVPNTSQKLAVSTGDILVTNSGAVFHPDDVTEGTHQQQKMETGLFDENYDESESGLFQYDGDDDFNLDNSEEEEIDVKHSESFTVDLISMGQSDSGVEPPERKVRLRRSKIKKSVHGFGDTIVKMVGSKPVSFYQCLCGTSFKSKFNCGRHIEDKNSQAHTCTICGSKLNSQRYLQKHRKRYHQSVE